MKKSKHNSVLLTGGTGKLGQALIRSGIYPSLLSSSRKELDVTRFRNVEKYLNENEIDAVIHCAALARMVECESHPVKAIETNIIGTCNLVRAVLNKEKKSKTSIRFVHISTDGVYSGIRGNYSEKDETIPFTTYGWTKLGAECSVNVLSNYCIIRTRFYDPYTVQYTCSAADLYTSKVTLDYLSKAISFMLESDFIGTINIGGERKSDFEIYREFIPSLQSCSIIDIEKKIGVTMGRDFSLNVSLWKEIAQK